MKMMLGALFTLFMICANQSFAATKTFTYDGQNSELVELVQEKKETRYKEEVVNDTCTRQIPYTVNECGPVTRYRQECRTEPARQDCRWVPDTQCRSVTRYREECRNEPGQRVCRQGPDREVCVTRNNGARICTTQPGEQICSDGPSRRVCQNVPYTDRVCETRQDYQCTWIPSRQICNDIPYTVTECNDVVRYRAEQYACTRTVQVPYEVVTHTYNAEVLVSFATSTVAKGAKVTVNLSDRGVLTQSITDVNPAGVVALVTERNESRSTGDASTLLKREAKVSFADLRNLKKGVEQGAREVSVSKEKISFKLKLPTVSGLAIDFAKQTSVKLYVTRKTVLGNTRVVLNQTLPLSKLANSRSGEDVKVTVDLEALGGDTGSSGKYEVSIETILDLSAQVKNNLTYRGIFRK
jgi:hypothetical protein